ncbi:hypothetical protein CONLIGDRAFT_128485 [Coniochaeta ligniaria NRRL 30616]|uniref:YCII-related domain-containing protein n=1 Tax=Coniochaeta ligniaria NRRL 30616 TaxID=1408157 RepID=A0A1J7I7Z3_9PEZI|nr:hypothetical protein CONLIGDRAFT_128485 [Coniochaeta ligniaria NRRL 30616]
MALRLKQLSSHLLTSSSNGFARTHPTGTTQSIRTMASAARKFEFLVVVPDFPGMREKRLEVRPTHFAGLKPHIDSGAFQMGGAVLSEVPADDEPSSLQFAGSTIIAVAESKEEVLAILKNDIYAQSGVWDVENAQIWPLKAAFRKAL